MVEICGIVGAAVLAVVFIVIYIRIIIYKIEIMSEQQIHDYDNDYQ